MANVQVTLMDDKPIKVTDADFDKVIKEKPLVIVDFWAEWCAPCRAVAPIVEDLAKKYAGQVTFAKLNTDENPEVPSATWAWAFRPSRSSKAGSSAIKASVRW